jgi:hypothetical protein
MLATALPLAAQSELTVSFRHSSSLSAERAADVRGFRSVVADAGAAACVALRNGIYVEVSVPFPRRPASGPRVQRPDVPLGIPLGQITPLGSLAGYRSQGSTHHSVRVRHCQYLRRDVGLFGQRRECGHDTGILVLGGVEYRPPLGRRQRGRKYHVTGILGSAGIRTWRAIWGDVREGAGRTLSLSLPGRRRKSFAAPL